MNPDPITFKFSISEFYYLCDLIDRDLSSIKVRKDMPIEEADRLRLGLALGRSLLSVKTAVDFYHRVVSESHDQKHY